MKRLIKWSLLLFTPFLLLGVYFEPTYCVRGWLWREAFYEGRPTSYWRRELERWHVVQERHSMFPRWYERRSTWFEQMCERWLPAEDLDEETRMSNLLELIHERMAGPRILRGEADAAPVLQALLDDTSPKIRLFAQIGLKMNPEIPGAADAK